MAIPTFVAAGTVGDSTSVMTPGLPAGHTTDDILLMFLETSGQAITVANWTQVPNSPIGTGSTATDTRLTLYWKRDNGSESAQVTSDSGDHNFGFVLAFRGCIATGNPWDITSANSDAVSNTSGSITGATTTVADCLVVTAIATSLPDAAGHPATNFSSWTNADLASLTERIDETTANGNGGGLGIATGTKAVAGVYGATTVTLASAAVKACMTIALKPATGGAPAETDFMGAIPL